MPVPKNTIKLTNKKLLDSVGGLQSLSNAMLPLRVSIHVAKNIRTIQHSIDDFESVRKKLVQNHTKRDASEQPVKDTNGNPVIADPVAFKEDFETLLEVESDVEATPFYMGSLGNEFMMKPGDLAALHWLILEGDAPDPTVPAKPAP